MKRTTKANAAALRTQTRKRLAKLNPCDIETILAFITIVETDRGTITPVEQFITGLVLAAQIRPLLPEFIDSEVKAFKENFEAAIDNARLLLRQYPQLVTAEPGNTAPAHACNAAEMAIA